MWLQKCSATKQKNKPWHVSICLLQSVYGVPDDGQSQPSPVHISSTPSRKPTKEDVQKEVTLAVTESPCRSLPPHHLTHPLQLRWLTRTDGPLSYLAFLITPCFADYLPERPAGQALHESVQSGRQPDELHGAVYGIRPLCLGHRTIQPLDQWRYFLLGFGGEVISGWIKACYAKDRCWQTRHLSGALSWNRGPSCIGP